jgi:hypothetical protein
MGSDQLSVISGRVEVVTMTRERYEDLRRELEELRGRVAVLEGGCDCGLGWGELGYCRFCGARSRYWMEGSSGPPMDTDGHR